ncbi:AMSH-like protease sst2 [Fulvia fulva]|uniref:AMSH-like protease sst2 n=1 Tax=Passalora fulva TaxID=5499 RepID=A0A9Q8UVB7_PASFU|nr:AMSH-like protease sst2 [Fulvia fulva]KAK4611935.1 AMSH-like protease sst2 [Fulvia fulva]KAK4612893.1 AMSH-like protease sst2 [Fulvia fulva]UJO23740.1 AMSH-like protease sst2 [Fulvia fulva]WPV21287.1 AMSH-like protease sst2 [Fulvia fulva]WPV36023.1 AMSH-like protease sst2 [Fulvia fulva]
MALSRHHAAFSKPRTVEEIVREAQNFDFNTGRSMQQWLRSAKMLLTEASICEEEGNYQTAYLYIYRHCELVLQKLPEHPDYRDPRYKHELAHARKAVQKGLVKLEQWKPRITQNYQRYVKAMERRNAERQRAQKEFNQGTSQYPSYNDSRRGSRQSLDSAPPSPTQTVSVLNDRNFAVELAHREIRRRDATRTSTKQAGISPGTVASRRQGIVGREYGDEGYDKNGVREAASHLERPTTQDRDEPRAWRRPHSSYFYPSVPLKEERIDWNRPPPVAPESRHALPPARPAKEALYDQQTSELASGPPRVPPRPRYDSPTMSASDRSFEQQPQLPSKYTFEPSAYTEAGEPLRTVILPPALRNAFLNLAHPNTARNMETCGILGATVISNALFITHLIVPDQTSTSDTCDTTEAGDNALFDYCDSKNLLVCGWIHTHPSQSCFLSSRDLHTSSGYQVMLPEAIAIVCAPRHMPDWGVFRLTDPPGLPHVLDCKQSGLFHPHTENNLYTDALRPGHVMEGPLEFEVVDLRTP